MGSSDALGERVEYAVEGGSTDRVVAARACRAVMDVLDGVSVRAEVDCFSDVAADMPAEIRDAEAGLRGSGRTGFLHSDPWMAVPVDRSDEAAWDLVRRYASWSINVDLYGTEPPPLATFHDCGHSIVARLTAEEAADLTRRLKGIAPVRPLSEIHEERAVERERARGARTAERRARWRARFQRSRT
ncbi:hypothetical protein [Cellulomonas cellasea]|uniref:Uncharacterized protein n=1 Tax=Cellulomonas cellasea TaxID=43670 RepID=A0A7W4UJ66_9CELL|nr:hypothetical protein [Cellulomonas cellasea]MBB2924498.1 hypothetical protein [Cellulomonas cellasea]